MKRKEFEEILEYRKSLKNKKIDYEKKLKCNHTFGPIIFTGFGTDATCLKCGEGFHITHPEDGSSMSKKHKEEENAKKKTKKENKWFKYYLNKTLKDKINDIDFALKNMKIIFFEQKFLGKPRIKILGFEEGGICCEELQNTTLHIIDGTTNEGNRYIFFDKTLSIRKAVLSSCEKLNWTEFDEP